MIIGYAFKIKDSHAKPMATLMISKQAYSLMIDEINGWIGMIDDGHDG